ncbi:uncharacterized protein METZ01_LOCUS441047 [marine metagenome]|uniref:Uncharacterized protein n=1 Tax=marine metagenome TaxID=408172 RepID=A0A382YYC8_9ZZZZ
MSMLVIAYAELNMEQAVIKMIL